MNVMAGVEKFGFRSAEVTNLYEGEKRDQSDSDKAVKRIRLRKKVCFWIRRSTVRCVTRCLRQKQ